MNVYSAIVAIVAIWGVVQVTRHWLGTRGEQRADQAEIERLESRIETLERIVTDQRESLRRQFDELQ